MNALMRAPLKPLRTYHITIVLKGLNGGPQLGQHYAERRKSLEQRLSFFSRLDREVARPGQKILVKAIAVRQNYPFVEDMLMPLSTRARIFRRRTL